MANSQEVIPQRKWMAHSTLNFFDRNPTAPTVRQVVHLAHDPVVKVMAKAFEVITRDTHYVTFTSRAILTDRVNRKIYKEEEIFKAEMAIAAQFERISEYFDARIKQGQQRLEAAGYDPDKDIKRVTKGYEALCVTRPASSYLSILTKADIYLAFNHFLWVAGEYSDNGEEADRARLNNERLTRDHLYSLSRATLKHFNDIRHICNGVVEVRREERAKQSQRDKAKAEAKKKSLGKKALKDAQRDMDKMATTTPAEAAAPAEAIL